MSLFTPVTGLLGGSIIGLSAATLLIGNGDILGCSGIVSSVLLNPREMFSSKNKWKMIFMSSFLVTSNLYSKYVMGSEGYYDDELNKMKSVPGIPFVSTLGYIVSGFLVGLGTKLGNGCTSGHGICGLARLSKRSIAAVMTFMATGVATASLCSTDNALRTTPDMSMFPNDVSSTIASNICALGAALCLPIFLKRNQAPKVTDKDDSDDTLKMKESINDDRKVPVAALASALFSVGLAISGMVKQYKVFSFLDMRGFSTGAWDGTLALVMGGGFVISAIAYQWVGGFNIIKHDRVLSCPVLHDKSCGKFNVPNNSTIDRQLILGAAIFGIGWGLGGLCPGPALFVAASGYPKVLYYWWPANFVGAYLGEQAKKYL
mmetsp:Transcript_4576/g.8825  ORF Transcript_4576/g.8825 Transcript_4576/m.8825 type:complete len:375 (+) Transcript_4576:288-1412(+)|eukprot:CAMPEP_0176486784 /NCGR_PEP_ID=MMETSP0200_2-20121128/5759_1 /TAXON_ID=947934 /ORGANISM="Chaetoceros sp., Strain GSL56" /LENGTH=374 /DNA_ID=CAMNT_0017883521 /DNA_START=230 /DNA_END=1354 /DNA_ORIENTATION=+